MARGVLCTVARSLNAISTRAFRLDVRAEVPIPVRSPPQTGRTSELYFEVLDQSELPKCDLSALSIRIVCRTWLLQVKGWR